MAEPQRRYKAFLLRLWQERNAGQWIWRASLQDPHSNERKGFSDLEQLLAFLRKQTEDSPLDET